MSSGTRFQDNRCTKRPLDWRFGNAVRYIDRIATRWIGDLKRTTKVDKWVLAGHIARFQDNRCTERLLDWKLCDAAAQMDRRFDENYEQLSARKSKTNQQMIDSQWWYWMPTKAVSLVGILEYIFGPQQQRLDRSEDNDGKTQSLKGRSKKVSRIRIWGWLECVSGWKVENKE